MDFSSLWVFCGFVVISVVIMIVISLFGIREKSYEEAIAEQKRRAQEMASQVKTDKVGKEKKKKHQKKSKEKAEKSAESDENPQADVPGPSKSPQPAAKGKTSAQSNKNSKPKSLTSSRSTEEGAYLEIPNESKKVEPKKEVVEQQPEKEVVKKKPVKEVKTETKAEVIIVPKKEERRYEAPPVVTEVKLQEPLVKNDVEVKNNNNQPQVKTEPVTAVVKKEELSSLPPSPAKKAKKQKFDLGSGDNGMSGTHLATVLRNAILTDTELQTLIDILLNRQQEGESWVKLGQKIDPISALKKQLQETEQKLSDEQLLSQTTGNKVKELRQELNKTAQIERSIREKFVAQQQEMQNLQIHLQRNHEQHLQEISGLQLKFQQLQVKTGEEHHLAIQRLQEENDKLKQALAQMEANAKNVTATEIAQLQCEADQWRRTCEQYKEQLNSNQQANSELQQRTHQMQQCIQDLTANNTQQEKALQQKVNDLMSQLSQSEAGRNSLQRDLCNFQTLQAENNNLHSQLLEIQKANDNFCRRIKELEEDIEVAETQSSVRVKDNEAKYHELRQQLEQFRQENQNLHLKLEDANNDIMGKESVLERQQNDLARYLDEVQQLTKSLDLQRQKNNEMICKTNSQLLDVQEALNRVFPEFAINQNEEVIEWVSRLEIAVKESQKNSDAKEELQICRAKAQEVEETLTSQVQHYEEVLRNTELLLKTLERRAEDEEHVWREKLLYKDNELAQIQERLSELHGKLLIEENERKLAELKVLEALKECSSLQNQLQDKTEEFLEEQKQYSGFQDKLSDLQSQLEAERKMSKDLTAQNVKLSSLVRIGQDSLKAEQEIVQELQKKIADQKVASNTTNGTSCTPTDSIDNLN